MRRLLLGIVMASLSMAQEASTQALEYLKAHEQVNGFSGSVLAVKNGKTVLRTGIGLASRELNVPNKPETVFRLGSITKQFTATAILLLQQDGKLKVEDTLDKHIPDAPEPWKKVQIHHLLSHTGGVPSYTSDPSYMREMFKPLPLPELIGRFRGKDLEFEPGSQYKYSNSGYVLLGDIIQRASGMSYEEFLRKRIFEPLGMKNSGYDRTERIIPNRAAGYSRAGSGWQNAAYLDMSQPHAAGSLYSTVDDLYIWHQALLTDKVLPQEVLQKMFTPVKNGYGYGWAVTTDKGRNVIGHGGGINGFSTFIGRIPADNTLVVVLSNFQNAGTQAIARDIGSLLYGESVTLPKMRQEVTLAPGVFDTYVGQYELSPNFKLRVFKEGNRYLTQATGQGQVEIYAESETKFFVRVVDAQITFEKDAAGKVTGITLHQNGRNMPGKRVE